MNNCNSWIWNFTKLFWNTFEFNNVEVFLRRSFDGTDSPLGLDWSIFMHTERVTNLMDPSRNDRGSDQSWQIFMDRLRSQLMNAFNHHVSLFEEHMRTEVWSTYKPDYCAMCSLLCWHALLWLIKKIGSVTFIHLHSNIILIIHNIILLC